MRLHARFGNVRSQFLDTVGDATGTINMNVDGSVTPVDYKIACPIGSSYEIHSLLLVLQSGGAFNAANYSSRAALTNGVKIYTDRPVRSPRLKDVTAQAAIKTNADWTSYLYNILIHVFGAGTNVLAGSYRFADDGVPLRLGAGDSLIVRVADDLSTLVSHTIRAGFTVYPRANGL